jgi:hypothetical protein
MGRRIVLAVLGLVVILVLAFVLGPRVPADTTIRFNPSVIGDDPQAYLAREEAAVPGIRDGLEKEIIWANPTVHARTPLSIVYIHGFRPRRARFVRCLTKWRSSSTPTSSTPASPVTGRTAQRWPKPASTPGSTTTRKRSPSAGRSATRPSSSPPRPAARWRPGRRRSPARRTAWRRSRSSRRISASRLPAPSS